MFDMNDILARLQDGDSAEAIAKEMSDALNAAQKAYDEAAHKANVEEAKREALRTMMSGLCDYMLASGEEELAKDFADMEFGDSLVEQIDGLIDMFKALSKLKNLEFPKVEEKKVCGNPLTATFTASNADWDSDMIIKNFLKGI